jgi:NADP-dependent 3-hydroxy acid dehydrogenase YdfG
MNNTVLITGASAGFGAACAEYFGHRGWRMVLAARRRDRLEALQKELETKNPVHVVALDVRSRQAVEHELSNLPEAFREIDVLVNNAGLALGLEPAPSANLDDWEQMIDTNIKGLVYCTRTVLPGMVERNRGHIINLGSIAGRWPYPGSNVYGATKAFVEQFSRNLRTDLHGTRIRVTNVEPGLAQSEFSVVRFKGDAHKAAEVYKDAEPLTPQDIAQIIFWIANLPPHVNVNAIEVMPTCQARAPLTVHREK